MSNKFTLLIICPTLGQTVVERNAIQNCREALANGHLVCLYITKKSYIDSVISDKSVIKIYSKLRSGSSFFSLHKFYSIKTIFNDFRIDAVHCYDIFSIWTLSFIMRKYQLIPLIYTHSKLLSRNFRGHIFTLLRRRIDLALAPTPYLEGDLMEKTGIKLSKIKVFNIRRFKLNRYELFDNKQGIYFLGTTVSDGERNIDNILALIFAIKLLKDQSRIAVKLIILFDSDYSKKLVAKMISNLVDELMLRDSVFYFIEKESESVIGSFDLWVDISSEGEAYDYSAMALESSIPVLMPRNILNIEILEIALPLKVGSTYSQGNARDIMKKIEKILTVLDMYQNNIKSLLEISNSRHEKGKIDGENMLCEYNRLGKLRNRFYSKRV